jgi:cobalt/nickel transport system permease protein
MAQARLLLLLASLLLLSFSVLHTTRLLLYGAALLCLLLALRLPLLRILRHATLLMLFGAGVALLAWWQGEQQRAIGVLLVSLLSALSVVCFSHLQSIEQTAAALTRLHVPPLLIGVVLMIWRFQHEARQQLQQMTTAAQARGGDRNWLATPGFLVTLMHSSFQQAEHVEEAMFARGWRGAFPLQQEAFTRQAMLLLGGGLLLLLLLAVLL